MKHVKKQNRFLTPDQKNLIRELSSTHYPKEIASILGCTDNTVLYFQLNPANGIENPKRKHVKTRKAAKMETTDGYFNIEAWAKEMAY
jgi:hypothetical protein